MKKLRIKQHLKDATVLEIVMAITMAHPAETAQLYRMIIDLADALKKNKITIRELS
jgi:hypothetical protein